VDVPILFEDNHVLVVDKPAGLLSQADLGGDLDLLTVLREMLKRRDGKPGNVYLGLVHRLDRPVSGAMMLAKTSKAAARLSDQVRRRVLTKIYRAVVGGAVPPDERELVHDLIKDRATRVTRIAAPGEGGAKQARLCVRGLEMRDDRSLVEVRLITGLPHQIRAQLSAIGHPIVGDRKYGGAPEIAPGRIALYSARLEFDHPVRREPVVATASPPGHWPW